MAVRPLEVKIDADVKGAVRGLDTLSESLDDVIEDLDHLADNGDDTARELAQDFRKIERAADDAGDKVKRHLSEGFDEAKGEALQSGREAAASFSGGFDDVADFVQETLANALTGFGPVGAVAGIALAAGIGAGLQALSDQQERLEELRDAAADLASTIYEDKGEIPLAEQVDRLLELLSQERRPQNIIENIRDAWSDLGTVLDDVRRAGRVLGSTSPIMRALGGSDIREARRQLDFVRDTIARLNGELEGQSAGERFVTYGDISALQTVETSLDEQVRLLELSRDMAGEVGAAYENAEYVAKVRALGDAWRDATTDASDYFTETEEGATGFDFGAWVKGLETAISDAATYKAKLVGLPEDIRAEAVRIFDEAGHAAAVDFIEGYEKAKPDTKRRAVAALTEIGKESGQGFADAAEAAARAQAQGWGPIPVTVKVRVDKSEWDRWVPDRKTAQLVAKVTGQQIATWE